MHITVPSDPAQHVQLFKATLTHANLTLAWHVYFTVKIDSDSDQGNISIACVSHCFKHH